MSDAAAVLSSLTAERNGSETVHHAEAVTESNSTTLAIMQPILNQNQSFMERMFAKNEENNKRRDEAFLETSKLMLKEVVEAVSKANEEGIKKVIKESNEEAVKKAIKEMLPEKRAICKKPSTKKQEPNIMGKLSKHVVAALKNMGETDGMTKSEYETTLLHECKLTKPTLKKMVGKVESDVHASYNNSALVEILFSYGVGGAKFTEWASE